MDLSAIMLQRGVRISSDLVPAQRGLDTANNFIWFAYRTDA